MKLVFIDNWLAYETQSSAIAEDLLFIGILIILFETLPLVIEKNLYDKVRIVFISKLYSRNFYLQLYVVFGGY